MTVGGIMAIFKPTMYRKNIFEIDYQKLKKMGITCLVFDLDNTIGRIEDKKCSIKVKKLFKRLQKDFLILVSSNNTSGRLKPYLTDLGVEGMAMAFKPLTKNLKRIRRKYDLKKNQMVMIGDQIVTDIFSGNRFNIMTILVDPLGEKDLKVTYFNRIIEDKIIDYYKRQDLFERGKYYE